MAEQKNNSVGKKRNKTVSGSQSMQDIASQKLADMPSKSFELMGKAPDALIHELQVHQIQLEMQAEELRRIQHELEISRYRYIDLFDFAPIGYLTLNDKAMVTEANLTISALLKIDRRKLVMTRFRKCISKVDHDAWDQYFIHLLRHQEKLARDLILVRDDGSTFPARIEGVRNTDSDGVITIRIAIIDITERKKTEEALLFTRHSIDSATETMATIDRNGHFVDVNDAFCRKSGYSRDELLSMAVKDIDPDYSKETWSAFWNKLKQSGSLTFKSTHHTKEGKTYPVEITSTYFEFGGKEYQCALARDITDRRKAEEALRVHAEIERNMSEAVFLIRVSDGVIVYTNPVLESLFGYDPGELLGRHVSVINAPGDKNSIEIANEIIESLTQKGVWSGEILNLRKDGTTFWSFANVITFEHPRHGKVWLSIHRDITERKRAETEIRNSRQLLQTVIDHSQFLVYAKDLEGRFILASKSLAELFGQPQEYLLGKTSHDFLPKAVADQHRVNDLEVMKRQELLRVEEPTESPEGTHTFLSTKFPLFDTGGKIYAVCGASVDITERKRIEEALRLSNKKLKLLSSITRHDIKNQVAVLRGFTTMLEKKQPNPLFSEYFQKITDSEERISAMIQFTKTYEDIGVGAMVWQDAGSLVDAAAKEVALSDIHLTNDIPAGFEIFADPLISRVFYNLVDNAVRHGETITTIRFTSEARNGERLIICEDDGEGVPDDEKEKIFERGFGKNTGLGLFMSREILDITGIIIRETGEEGKGARFEMVVPKGAWRMAIGDGS